MKKDSFIYNFLIILLMQIFFNIFIFHECSLIFILFCLTSSIISSCIITILSRLTNNITINKILNIILLLPFIIIIIGQEVHYEFYNSFFSFLSMLSGAKQVMGFFNTIFACIINNAFYIIILLLPFILFIIFNKKINFEKLKLKTILYYIGSIIISFTFALFIINSDKNSKDIYSKYNLYNNVYYPTYSAKTFGIIKTFSLDIYRYFINFEDKIITNDVFNEISNDNNYNVTNINFDDLINNEKDYDIIKMHEYFKNKEPSLKNKYTGIFKDKNLIFITGESVNINAIKKDITPTLYMLTHNGFVFNNFYTPIYYASTSDGEYTNLTGLLPTEGTWSMIKSSNNNMKYSLPAMFKTNDYKTYAYHNNTYNFYNRDITYPNLGFEKYTACGNGLEKKINCNIWPESDLEMLNETYNDYKNDDKFLAYYMTVSTHLNYKTTNNDIVKKNINLVKDLNYSSNVLGYISTHIELDKALENLIKNLKKDNLLDDTVIVLLADHFPYGLSKNELEELNKDIKYDDSLIHKNFLVIYNSTLKKPIIIDNYSSNIDVLPTLYNLFGFDYDSRLLTGCDILSNNDGIVIFNDRSFITKNIKYNALNNKFNDKKNLVYEKYLYSRLILEKDYYKYIK